MHTITVIPDNVKFTPMDGETILEAGLKQKLNLPHSCKNGVCATCKCKIISGSVALNPYNKLILSEAEIESGYTLLCRAHATSDVVLDIPNLLTGFPVKMLPAKVESVVKVGNTAIINLKLPANQKFEFYAGQYIEIMLKNQVRSYSLANMVNELNQLELHVKHHPGGAFSDLIWNNELKAGSILRFKGPFGTFKLQQTATPILLVCSGTGFAPIKAILEDMSLSKNMREIHLFWGNRTLKDFYLPDVLPKLQMELNLKVTLCLSNEKAENYFSGYVTHAVVANFTNLDGYELYACGNRDMIADIYTIATKELHLQAQNFFSDVFTPSVE